MRETTQATEAPVKSEVLDLLPKTPPKASNTLNILGLVLTVVWMAVLGVYATGAWSKFEALAPNEMGDFFAGAFAPLAFLWLVLGFFQQGKELRHSGEALWIQGRELQHSVEQQRELVNVTREQLKFESDVLREQRLEIARSSKPVLKLTAGRETASKPDTRNQSFHVSNHGKRCTNLEVTLEGYDSPLNWDVLETGARQPFDVELDSGEFAPITVSMTFLDERMVPGSATFLIGRKENKLTITEKAAGKPPKPKVGA